MTTKTLSKIQENPIEQWIRESDVDGRKILFQFTDSDIPILRDAIRQEINETLAQLKEEIENINPEYKENKSFWKIKSDEGFMLCKAKVLAIIKNLQGNTFDKLKGGAK